MTVIIPTVGHKLHFFPDASGVADKTITQLDSQPIDATVVYAHPKTDSDPHHLVNLHIIDHAGVMHFRGQVPLAQDESIVVEGACAQWMPYQVGQAKASAAPEAESPAPSSAASASPAIASESLAGHSAAPIAESPSAAANAPAQEIAVTAEGLYGFDVAIRAIKDGKAATRKAWGGDVFIYHVPAASYKAQTGIAKKVFGEDALVPYMAYIAIKRSDGKVCVFNPGVDSILAEDWEISK